jgi:hypothetical protein
MVSLSDLLPFMQDVPRGTRGDNASLPGDPCGQTSASLQCQPNDTRYARLDWASQAEGLVLRFPWAGREALAEIRFDEKEILDAAEIQIKYAGYIDRERRLAEKILRLEDLEIPEDFDFQRLTALSMECRIKLERYRPRTIAQASRISGVSPADISVLLVYFGR